MYIYLEIIFLLCFRKKVCVLLNMLLKVKFKKKRFQCFVYSLFRDSFFYFLYFISFFCAFKDIIESEFS